MKSKGLYFAIVVVIILVAGYLAFGRPSQKAQAPTTPAEKNFSQSEQPKAVDQSQPQAPPTSVPENQNPASAGNQPAAPGTNAPPPAAGHFSTEGDIMAPDVMVAAIDYDGANFAPASVDIKVGDVVIFRNKSAKAFWPASAPHPVHTDYPAFDAKGAVAPGQSYQFKFTQLGNWKFHDHLNPSARGVVNVSAK